MKINVNIDITHEHQFLKRTKAHYFVLPTKRWPCKVVYYKVVRVMVLTPLSTVFQLYLGGQFYWWRKSWVPGENHWPVASHWQTLSHNVVSKILRLSGIWTHNISGERHWLHLYVVVNPTTIRSRPGWPLIFWNKY